MRARESVYSGEGAYIPIWKAGGSKDVCRASRAAARSGQGEEKSPEKAKETCAHVALQDSVGWPLTHIHPHPRVRMCYKYSGGASSGERGRYRKRRTDERAHHPLPLLPLKLEQGQVKVTITRSRPPPLHPRDIPLPPQRAIHLFQPEIIR